MASAHAFGTTSNRIALAGMQWRQRVTIYVNVIVVRAQRLCQRSDTNSECDVEHMIFGCVAMGAERQKH